MNLFVLRDGRQEGPYSHTAVQQMLAVGRLAPTDWACAEGWPQWIQLQHMPAGGPPIPMTSHPADPDQVFLSEGRVTVTRSRLIVGSTSFALQSVVSYRIAHDEPPLIKISILGIGGAIASLLIPWGWVVGVPMILIAGWLLFRKTPYQLALTTSNGQVVAMESLIHEDIARISNALGTALATRAAS